LKLLHPQYRVSWPQVRNWRVMSCWRAIPGFPQPPWRDPAGLMKRFVAAFPPAVGEPRCRQAFDVEQPIANLARQVGQTFGRRAAAGQVLADPDLHPKAAARQHFVRRHG
jgi:hypothetical protein